VPPIWELRARPQPRSGPFARRLDRAAVPCSAISHQGRERGRGQGARAMTNVAVVGAQWGDEGKGKIVDWLS
jgi:hypothetical protein